MLSLFPQTVIFHSASGLSTATASHCVLALSLSGFEHVCSLIAKQECCFTFSKSSCQWRTHVMMQVPTTALICHYISWEIARRTPGIHMQGVRCSQWRKDSARAGIGIV